MLPSQAFPSLPSDHFRNGRFFNSGAGPRGFRDVMRWMLHRERGPWREWVAATSDAKPAARLADPEGLRATFVNHATVLLQLGELNLLTDPMWSLRASPVQWLGPKRHRAPGVRFEDLPRIDAILLSHNHYDHLDVGTLKRLLHRDAPPIFCPLGVARQLRKIGYREIEEMDWWQHGRFGELEIHCVPAQHFSARTPFDRDRTLWCGWAIKAAGGAVCFAGDTGYGEHFAEIAARFSPLRLALLPIGAYRPEWFMAPVHMSPDEALAAHRVLGAQVSIALHFGTFSLADDGETEAPDRLRALLAGTEEETQFRILEEGQALDVTPVMATANEQESAPAL